MASAYQQSQSAVFMVPKKGVPSAVVWTVRRWCLDCAAGPEESSTIEVQRLQTFCRRNCWVFAPPSKSERQLSYRTSVHLTFVCLTTVVNLEISGGPQRACVLRGRVVSSEISGGKFPKMYSSLSGNLLVAYVNQLFPSPALQSDAVK